MLTILSSLIGFFSSFVPDILNFFKEQRLRKHELTLIDKQLDAQTKGYELDLAKVREHTEQTEIKALYKHAEVLQGTWVYSLSAAVRPIISYSFFFLYAGLKVFDFIQHRHFVVIWTQEDMNIFAAIISFWFGHRAFRRNGNGNGNGHSNGNGNGH